jgi:hydroxylamine reductase
MNMFCYQCEQTANGRGCDKLGVCGKDAQTAVLQDLLLYAAKGISQYANKARQLGVKTSTADVFVIDALFTTVTNVNFDAARIESLIRKAADVKKATQSLYEDACRKAGKSPEKLAGPAQWTPAATSAGLLEQALPVGIVASRTALGDDLAGLQELLTYGLKGTAAYVNHAYLLGKEDDKVYAYMHEALDYLTQPSPTVDALFGLNLKCGEINLIVMEMLDSAHTGAYGHPVPTKVRGDSGQRQGNPCFRP